MHDLQDAFQATLLVLVRKAHSIRKSEAVGGWLYGVAYRVALKVKAEAARRQKAESAVRTADSWEAADVSAELELRRALDEEILRLPAKYRTPLVLCYFEGKTYTAAARESAGPRDPSPPGWPGGAAPQAVGGPRANRRPRVIDMSGTRYRRRGRVTLHRYRG